MRDDPPERIGVDFDGTLTLGEESYFTDEPEQPDHAVISWVRDQYKQGHTILIFTARPWSVAGETAGLLTQWGVPYHGLRCEKGSADVYLDDKAMLPDAVVPRTASDDAETGQRVRKAQKALNLPHGDHKQARQEATDGTQ